MNRTMDYNQLESLADIIDSKLRDLTISLSDADCVLCYPDEHRTYLSEPELKRLIEAIEKSFKSDGGKSYRELLSFHMNDKKIKAHELYDAASIEKSYFYKMLTGKLTPSRDVCIRVCLALKIDFDESKDLLQTLGYSFYEKNRRDIIVTECIRHKTGLYTTELLLERYGEVSLCSTSILLRN